MIAKKGDIQRKGEKESGQRDFEGHGGSKRKSISQRGRLQKSQEGKTQVEKSGEQSRSEEAQGPGGGRVRTGQRWWAWPAG